MRAARRVVKLANQSPNHYLAGIAIGWPGRPSGTLWPTNRTANGVGRSNFKISHLSAHNPRHNPKSNFEIGTPDPNFKPSPPKNTPSTNQATAPHPNHTTNSRQYMLSHFVISHKEFIALARRASEGSSTRRKTTNLKGVFQPPSQPLRRPKAPPTIPTPINAESTTNLCTVSGKELGGTQTVSCVKHRALVSSSECVRHLVSSILRIRFTVEREKTV